MPKVKNLFIVEDSPIALKSIERLLKNCPFKVHSFSDPILALESLSTISPDIILLDYFMPEMTGAEFMVKVSERLLHNPNWQVYLISGHQFEEEDLASMLTLGITKIFKKPLNKNELLEAISQYEAQ